MAGDVDRQRISVQLARVQQAPQVGEHGEAQVVAEPALQEALVHFRMAQELVLELGVPREPDLRAFRGLG